MAHHGTGHARFNRVMRKKYQLDSAYFSETGRSPGNHATPTIIPQNTVANGLEGELTLDPVMQAQDVHDSQGLSLEKRQQSNTATGDQATVSATIVNVVDNNSQTSTGTSATAPTTISEESTVPATSISSTETDSLLLSLSATVSIDLSLTASPAYSSPTADTPAVTSTPEPSSSTPPSSAPATSKTSTPLFGSTATAIPSSAHPQPSSALSSSSPTGTQSGSQVTASGSAWAFGSGSQSTTTSSVTQTSSATTSTFSSDSTSTTSLYGAWAGGVVGGVAAAMFVFVIVVWLLRRRKKNILPPSGDALPEPDTTGTAEGSLPRSAEMTSRRSSDDPLFTASYFAPAFMKRWRQSHMTTRTDSTLSSEPSERGFQKISGRKIPSVLQSGGDGYGGGYEPGSPTASEPSTLFSPSSPVQPRSPPTQPPVATPYGMPLDTSYTREAAEVGGVVVFRPSPARTPVTGSANASLSNEPTGPRVVSQVGALSPTMPKRPDALGRSHPSFDGSRGSRFTESI
ncbi:fructose-bisphosphate aldolase, class II [Aspergillus niger]|uniref:Fructose-bisphosphate aldolase, class II n=1 Tax=Aspergillus niger TaxID=5061 RepID=A0A505IA57_ASPNG|nr:fructose-bisphosphate aldolase, class II [Aspergillus niger]